MRSRALLIIAAAFASYAPPAAAGKQPHPGITLPLAFEPNRGQAPFGEYVAHTRGFAVSLAAGNLDLQARHSHVSAMLVEASAPSAKPEATLPTTVGYFRGNDPARWIKNLPTWARVRYSGVYPGIDIVYYGAASAPGPAAAIGGACLSMALEYDFVVRPGADASRIAVRYVGVRAIRVDAAGNLAIDTGDGPLLIHKPSVYQEIGGARRRIEGRYLLAGNIARFALGPYDHSQPLTIDPTIGWSTYFSALAGTTEVGEGLATDASGNVYLVGSMISIYGDSDIFFCKFNASGAATLVNYYGGSYDDYGHAIAVDATGAFYLAGETDSFDYPADYAYDSYDGSTDAAYISKIDPTGQTLIYSHFFGGSGSQAAYTIALDAASNAYIGGVTNSVDLPVSKGASQTAIGGGYDGFLAEFNAAGNGVYSTYFGGSGDDAIYSIAADSAGDVFATGQAGSVNFPVSANAYQAKLKGGSDAFAAKFAPTTGAMVLSTLLGGGADDAGNSIAVDSSGAMYITGETVSVDFPVLGAPQSTYGGGGDAYLAKLTGNGQTLVYSTYLGGSAEDFGNAIVVDGNGNAYIAGATASTNFPVPANALQAANQGATNGIVAGLSADGSTVLFATYLGGEGAEGAVGDYATALAYNSAIPALVVAGVTSSDNFPTASASAVSLFQGGQSNAFVTQISLAPPAATAGQNIRGSEMDAPRGISAPKASPPHSTTHLKFRRPIEKRRQPR